MRQKRRPTKEMGRLEMHSRSGGCALSTMTLPARLVPTEPLSNQMGGISKALPNQTGVIATRTLRNKYQGETLPPGAVTAAQLAKPQPGLRAGRVHG